MKGKIHYEGIFFDEENIKIIKSLEKHPHPLIHDEIHLTFKYKPKKEECFDNLVGKEFLIYLVGYGYDKENSGFEVELPKELSKYYINKDEDDGKIKVAHITSSITENAKAVNTKKLKFEKLEKKIIVKGKFGYWIEEGEKEYLSFKLSNNFEEN